MKVREAKFEETDRELYGWKFTIYDSNKARFFIALAITVLLVVALAVISHLADATPPLPKYGEEVTNTYYPEEVSLKMHCSEFAEFSPTPEIIPTEVVKAISLKATVRKKTYMDYRAITRLGSRQLDLQSKAWTDWQGFRRVDEYYMVALGTYYVKEIGDRFIVTIARSEKPIKVIAGDIKADEHTDSQNRFHTKDGSEIEFIIDKNIINKKVLRTGDCSYVIGQGQIEVKNEK